MKFSIDEIEIIDLEWPNYNFESSWEEFFAVYDEYMESWILLKHKSWTEWKEGQQ